jgi:hypothetical protein
MNSYYSVFVWNKKVLFVAKIHHLILSTGGVTAVRVARCAVKELL